MDGRPPHRHQSGLEPSLLPVDLEKWGQCANLDKMSLQPAASQASLRNTRERKSHGY